MINTEIKENYYKLCWIDLYYSHIRVIWYNSNINDLKQTEKLFGWRCLPGRFIHAPFSYLFVTVEYNLFYFTL